MQRITDVAGGELRWQQPSAMQQRYELRAGGEIVETLAFRSGWGTLATAEAAEGCWTFKRVGFWQTRATVRACGAEAELASFKNNTWRGGGTLTLTDGQTFHMTTNTWQTRLEVLDSQERQLLRYATEGWIKQGAVLTVAPEALALPELPWLAALGWYVVVMMHRDSAAVAVVAAT